MLLLRGLTGRRIDIIYMTLDYSPLGSTVPEQALQWVTSEPDGTPNNLEMLYTRFGRDAAHRRTRSGLQYPARSDPESTTTAKAYWRW